MTPTAPRRRTRFRSMGAAALALLAGLVPVSAFAQAAPSLPNLFTPPPHDLLMNLFFDKVLGPLVGSGTSSPIAALAAGFNAIVLMLGGVIVTYTLFVGIFNSAKDGQFMGKTWSAPWIATRTALGSAAIMPVIGKSFCVLQWLVVWLAVQGIGAGDALWSAYLASPNLFGPVYMQPDARQQMTAAIEQMLIGETCVYNHNRNLPGQPPLHGVQPLSMAVATATNQDTTYAVTQSWVKPPSTANVTWLGKNLVIDFGGPGHPDACGRIVVQWPATSAGVAQAFGTIPGVGGVTGLSQFSQYKVIQAVQSTVQGFMAQVLSDVTPIAQSIVTGQAQGSALTEFTKTVPTLLNAYDKDMQGLAETNFIKASSPVTQALVKNANQVGMADAGSFYMMLTQLQSAMSTALSVSPSVSNPTQYQSGITPTANSIAVSVANQYNLWQHTGLSSASAGLTASGAEACANARMDRMPNVSGQYYSPEATNQDQQACAAAKAAAQGGSPNVTATGATKEDPDIAHLAKSFNTSAASWVTWLGNGNENPIMVMTGIGGKLTEVAWDALAAAAGTAFIPLGGGTIAQMFIIVGMSALVPGLTLEYYIPAMPYIYWMMAIAGFLFMLIELVFAAPIWGLAHIFPDGEGFVGRAGQGYMAILSLFLTPSLLVIGLVISIVIMVPIASIVNATIGDFMMYTMNLGHDAGNPIPMLMSVLIYTVILYQIVKMVFGLIHSINDKVLGMIGGRTQIGEVAQHGEGGISAGMAGGIMAIRQGQEAAGSAAKAIGHGANATQQVRAKNKEQGKQAEKVLHGSMLESGSQTVADVGGLGAVMGGGADANQVASSFGQAEGSLNRTRSSFMSGLQKSASAIASGVPDPTSGRRPSAAERSAAASFAAGAAGAAKAAASNPSAYKNFLAAAVQPHMTADGQLNADAPAYIAAAATLLTAENAMDFYRGQRDARVQGPAAEQAYLESATAPYRDAAGAIRATAPAHIVTAGLQMAATAAPSTPKQNPGTGSNVS